MKIDQNTVVAVKYILKSKTSGETVEETSEDQPFIFLFGAGQLLPDFESNLQGKQRKDAFDFFIDAANGYGIHSEENVVDLPIAAFADEDGKPDEEILQVGAELPMMDGEGNSMYGIVVEVGTETVKMDFNHPLAGHDLHFSGEVLDVRAATPEEIAALQAK
jgi:FKBP-type peptidyl-prolyl cis-trans isomerase SlyD